MATIDAQLPDRTRVRRTPQRGHYDRPTIDAILDSQPFAHVAFVEAGQPFCVPMLHARVGDQLYVHGSTASRAMRTLRDGNPACVSVTTIDGLVLARSVFHHSANYRSAMLLGTFRLVEGEAARLAAMAAFTNKLVPGRWEEVRPPSRSEMAATMILSMAIEEASAKIRTGPPSDDDSPDADIDTWAGVIPIVTSYGQPQASPGLRREIGLAASVQELLRGHQGTDRVPVADLPVS
jgi:nitroimidazol reductase NimA-like FMN-containing flavoprotein (pyridoxamine 5'-phosphate oxidase superfamily)